MAAQDESTRASNAPQDTPDERRSHAPACLRAIVLASEQGAIGLVSGGRDGKVKVWLREALLAARPAAATIPVGRTAAKRAEARGASLLSLAEDPSIIALVCKNWVRRLVWACGTMSFRICLFCSTNTRITRRRRISSVAQPLHNHIRIC